MQGFNFSQQQQLLSLLVCTNECNTFNLSEYALLALCLAFECGYLEELCFIDTLAIFQMFF